MSIPCFRRFVLPIHITISSLRTRAHSTQQNSTNRTRSVGGELTCEAEGKACALGRRKPRKERQDLCGGGWDGRSSRRNGGSR